MLTNTEFRRPNRWHIQFLSGRREKIICGKRTLAGAVMCEHSLIVMNPSKRAWCGLHRFYNQAAKPRSLCWTCDPSNSLREFIFILLYVHVKRKGAWVARDFSSPVKGTNLWHGVYTLQRRERGPKRERERKDFENMRELLSNPRPSTSQRIDDGDEK